ncbi:MAG: hypothetical protein GY946_07850 [bacterium]|nr:hypothetical protein [bacterium]
MRSTLFILLAAVPFLVATHAQAKSCSTFGILKSFDEAGSTVEVEFTKGKATKFFPRVSGATGDITKIPGKCKRRTLKQTTVPVKATGGKLSVTQIRNNLSGKMLNDTESVEWFKAEVGKIIAAGEPVVLVLRPGRKKTDPVPMTTIYLPATAEDMAEIQRLEDQVSDED